MMRRPETPLRAISAYCLAECCLGKPHRVESCQKPSCPLYAFRYGTDPYQIDSSRSPDASCKHRSVRLPSNA